jgi:hypothetical protein
MELLAVITTSKLKDSLYSQHCPALGLSFAQSGLRSLARIDASMQFNYLGADILRLDRQLTNAKTERMNGARQI